MNFASDEHPKFFALGETALTVEFGNAISATLNRRATNLAKYFEENPFSGLNELIPGYASLTFCYDVYVVKHTFPNFPTAFSAVKSAVETALERVSEADEPPNDLIEIPVSFAPPDAPDLEYVAERNRSSMREVVEIFTARTYTVYMLGFLPGFAYLGEVDERIAAPRKDAPRVRVPAGSVGIAGRQTGIYPLESPGGWQIIGRTNAKMFAVEKQPPTLLSAGMRVKFYESAF